MEARDIPLAKLRVRLDARSVDTKSLDALTDSVREVGFVTSILVRPITIFEGGREAEGYEIIAGRHRFEVAQRLQFLSMPCRIAEYDDLHAELAMLDENLRRANYSPIEDSQAIARRKEIYEILHPEARLGGAGTGREKVRQVGEAIPADRFTLATAKATGRSERVVQRQAERGEKISERVVSMIRGTHLDKGAYLDQIKDLGPKEQEARVQRELAAPRKPISPAPEPRNAYESEEIWLAKLVKVFEAAPQEWRERARDHLYPDTAVMDHSDAVMDWKRAQNSGGRH
jgi:ParB family chromosome partitioning protein